MGDRCYMYVKCAKRDVKRFEAWFGDGEEYEADVDGIVTLTYEEMNYAGGIPDGWPTDIPYEGYHGEGGDYPAEHFVCIGDKKLILVTESHGDIVVSVNSKGDPGKAAVSNVKNYMAACRVIKNRLLIRAKGVKDERTVEDAPAGSRRVS